MELSEILEENNVQGIHKQTKISVDTLNRIISKDFSSFKKVQAFGFISILEREYGSSKVEDLRQACEEYFETNAREDIVYISPTVIEAPQKPQWILWLAGFGILALTIYFIMQSSMTSDIPAYTQEANTTKLSDINHSSELNASMAQADKNITIPAVLTDTNSSFGNDINSTVSQQSKIIPKTKLWFGMMDVATKGLQNSIISEAFNIDTTKQWLIATSKASFSLQSPQGTKEFADYKVHYFKVDNTGITEITKEQFVTLGGPKRW